MLQIKFALLFPFCFYSMSKKYDFYYTKKYFAKFSGEKNPKHPQYGQGDDAGGSSGNKIEEFVPSRLIGSWIFFFFT